MIEDNQSKRGGNVMISSHIRFFAYLICLPKPYISMLPKCIR